MHLTSHLSYTKSLESLRRDLDQIISPPVDKKTDGKEKEKNGEELVREIAEKILALRNLPDVNPAQIDRLKNIHADLLKYKLNYPLEAFVLLQGVKDKISALVPNALVTKPAPSANVTSQVISTALVTVGSNSNSMLSPSGTELPPLIFLPASFPSPQAAPTGHHMSVGGFTSSDFTSLAFIPLDDRTTALNQDQRIHDQIQELLKKDSLKIGNVEQIEATAKKFAAAKELAAKIQHSFMKEQAELFILLPEIKFHLNIGRYDEAKKLAIKITQPKLKGVALLLIFDAFCKSHDFAAAFDLKKYMTASTKEICSHEFFNSYLQPIMANTLSTLLSYRIDDLNLQSISFVIKSLKNWPSNQPTGQESGDFKQATDFKVSMAAPTHSIENSLAIYLHRLNQAWLLVNALNAVEEINFLKLQVEETIKHFEAVLEIKKIIELLHSKIIHLIILVNENQACQKFIASHFEALITCIKTGVESNWDEFQSTSILSITADDQLANLQDPWIDLVDAITTNNIHAAQIIQLLEKNRTSLTTSTKGKIEISLAPQSDSSP